MTLLKSSNNYREFAPAAFTDMIDNFFKTSNEINQKNEGFFSFSPKVDIAETETEFEISLQLAGISKEDIKIELVDGKLSISGERKLEKKTDEKKYHKIETQYGAFHRTFVLPEKTNAEAIEASFNNGILQVRIPKEEKKILKSTILIK
jgi:HSP20 family protein